MAKCRKHDGPVQMSVPVQFFLLSEILGPPRSSPTVMPADLMEKTSRYEALLDQALGAADPALPGETPLGEAAADFESMARSYLEDGRHFLEADDPVNALAAFAYGHAWLDAGARLGLFQVPDTDLFAA